jgi:hypothetical protein
VRTWDARHVAEAIEFYIGKSNDIDPIVWISDQRNIALTNEDGDLALFEFAKVGVCGAHYWFKTRGKVALANAHKLLDEIFDPCYNIQVITGMTPLTNLAARWMTRRLGFTSHGHINARGKHMELFILTKREYYA